MEIVESEAEIIRRIFSEYASGRTPREIARDLNAEGVAAPRGSRWAASTINGNKTRHYGILCGRALFRCPRLESRAHGEGPRHRQARVAGEPARGMEAGTAACAGDCRTVPLRCGSGKETGSEP
nr:recombinase family protein [Rhodovulum sp.]